MYEKTYKVGGHMAHTLNPEEIGENESGWIIYGPIHTDYYEWVNEFAAYHPEYGFVWGDFEGTVYAQSKEGFDHFIGHHEPDSWDYYDI